MNACTKALIYGNEVEVKLDSYIVPDGWTFGGIVIASDWDKADFCLTKSASYAGDPIESLAVNVTITGSTWQRRQGDYWIRVKIEFVGDGEPSVFSGGWMLRK